MTDGQPASEGLYARFQRLKEQADNRETDFNNWFPSEAGEEISGAFLRYAEARFRSGEPATVAVLQTVDGTEWSVWLTHAVLRDRLADLRPGELVYIRFDGKRTSEAGRGYNAYSVERDASELPPLAPDERPF